MLDLFYMFLSRYKTNRLEEIKKYFSALQKQFVNNENYPKVEQISF